MHWEQTTRMGKQGDKIIGDFARNHSVINSGTVHWETSKTKRCSKNSNYTCIKPDPLSNILKPPLPLITPLLGPNLESLPETLDKK